MNCTWREDEDGNWWQQCIKTGWNLPKVPNKCFTSCPDCGQPITEIGFDEDAEESE